MEVDITLESKGEAIIKSEPVQVKSEPLDNQVVDHALMEPPADTLLGDEDIEIKEPKDEDKIMCEVEVKMEPVADEFTECGETLEPVSACKLTCDMNDIKSENCGAEGQHASNKTVKATFDHDSQMTGVSHNTVEKTGVEKKAGKKPFSCKTCNKTFAWRTRLTDHERTHTGDKPFKCTICHRQYAVKSNLTSHIRIHTGETPYSCDICHKRFRQKSSLYEHTRIHTGEKPLSCKYCNRKFKSNSTLYNHQRVHTGEKPFRCKICDKRFAQKSHLNVHDRIHTGQKRFSCNICDKPFAQKANLVNHERTHTGEKPYKCTMCFMRFAQKGTQQNHERLHTRGKPQPSINTLPQNV